MMANPTMKCLLVLVVLMLVACGPTTRESETVLLEVAGDPTVTFKIWFKVGSQNDPEGKEGLANLTGEMIADAATTSHSYEDILQTLYPLASSYYMSVDREMSVLTGRSHRDNLDKYLPLYVDAVLRPANHTLDPASSVSTHLDQLAGQAFSTVRQVAAPLEIGSAVVTTAGELAAPYVLHVIISSDQINTDRSAVQRALASAWHRATEWQLARIATPLVGSGAGQLSLEDAAELMRNSLQSRTQADYPTEVQLVVEREADKDIVDEIIRRGS